MTIPDALHPTAIVVGGSRGIGFGIAGALVGAGYRLLLTGRDQASVDRARNQLPLADGFAPCDVRYDRDVEGLFAFAGRRLGRIDVVVNCAGIGRTGRGGRLVPEGVAELGVEEWDAVMDVNLTGMFRVSRRAAALMIPQGAGQIVNISSARGAQRGQPFGSAYSASKMAVRVLFQALQEELRPFGVRAFSVLPDAVDTDLISGTGLARRGAVRPEQMGDFVLSLLSLPRDVVLEDVICKPR